MRVRQSYKGALQFFLNFPKILYGIEKILVPGCIPSRCANVLTGILAVNKCQVQGFLADSSFRVNSVSRKRLLPATNLK